MCCTCHKRHLLPPDITTSLPAWLRQVACGGDHTLAVCQHEVREAEARAGADRRLLGSWSKRREALSIDLPPPPSGRDAFGGPGSGLPPSASSSHLQRDSGSAPLPRLRQRL